MRSLAVLFMLFCFVFGASRVHAEQRNELPPLGTWLGPSIVPPDFLLDFKGDKTLSATDQQSGKPPIKKEEVVPFLGLSLTRPFDYRN